MSTPQRLNIAAVIDSSKIAGGQIRLFVLCALSLLMGGFVVQTMAYVGPEIIVDFDLPNGGPVGNIVAATNFGLLIGSLFFTVLADKIGRRPVLIIGTFYFAILTLLTGLLAQTAGQLMILRFIGGIGMGSIVPNATALIGEYSPTKRRVTLMMTITVSFTAGAAMAAFVSAAIMPLYGWRSVFYVGGSIPLVAAILMVLWLPESLRFLTVRKRFDEVGHWLKRVDPSRAISPDTEYVLGEEDKGGVPVVHLLTNGRAWVTLLYWCVNFTNLLNLYFLAGMLPTILNQTIDMSSTASSLVAGAMQVGGTIGTFGLAWMIAKKGLTPMLTVTFAVAALAIAAIASQTVLGVVPLLTITVFIAGWCIIGGQPGLNAFAAMYYPTFMRSTGIGWGLGIGRVGAILGPYIGGRLLTLEWGPEQMFLAFAGPAAVSMLIMIGIHMLTKPSEAR
jgi:AAHS family 4-hydroxybenzoate transporter-like MFS transporter